MIADEQIRPRVARKIDGALECICDLYRGDPYFAELLRNQDPDELDGLRSLFDERRYVAKLGCESLSGCWQGVQLVGAVVAWPENVGSILRSYLMHPLRAVAMQIRLLGNKRKHQARLRRAVGAPVRQRWTAYTQVGARQRVVLPALHVTAFGVAPAARQTGVARGILDTLVNESRWRDQAQWIVADTWQDTNRAIYERLGFCVHAEGKRRRVRCWTMVRPIDA